MAENENESENFNLKETSNDDVNEAEKMDSHSKDKVKFNSIIENIGDPPSVPIPPGIGEGEIINYHLDVFFERM